MEAKIEAKTGQTSGRYSTEVNAIRVVRVRSQDICSGHGPHLHLHGMSRNLRWWVVVGDLFVFRGCPGLDGQVCVKFTLRQGGSPPPTSPPRSAPLGAHIRWAGTYIQSLLPGKK